MIRWVINILGGNHVQTLRLFPENSATVDSYKSYKLSMTTTTFYESLEVPTMGLIHPEIVDLHAPNPTESDTKDSHINTEALRPMGQGELTPNSIQRQFSKVKKSQIKSLPSDSPSSTVTTNSLKLKGAHYRNHSEDLDSLYSSKTKNLPTLETDEILKSSQSDRQLPVIENSPEWTYGYDPQYQRRVLDVTSKFIKKMDNQDAADFVNTLDPLLVEELLKDNSLPPVVKGIVIGRKSGKNQVSLANFLNTQRALKDSLQIEKDLEPQHNLTGVKDGN